LYDLKNENIFSLRNKVIVITGATGLLGRKHAEAVAAYGGSPILVDIRDDEANRFAGELSKNYNVKSEGYKFDITDEQAVSSHCSQIMKVFGRIDGLVNNAANNPKIEATGTKNFSRLEHFPLEIWNQDLAVGLTGSFLMSKYFGYAISQNEDGGSIVNISSDLGLIAPDQRLYKKTGLPGGQQPVKPITYSVVKTGLIGLTRYLATYWPERQVRCNAICPGGVENGQDPGFIEDLITRIPLGRMAQSHEYQGLVIFLLSEASRYLNGAIIPADGGRSVW
jgi:NAD(P)-dependent dehydrogenase (short-subunit alcohol dehydrogenase family)